MYVRVNVHFVQDYNGKFNFRRFDDGRPCNADTAWNGYYYAQELIRYANLDQATNPSLNMPPANGQPGPQQPKRVMWVLHGVYFNNAYNLREWYNQTFFPVPVPLSPYYVAGYDALSVEAESVINLFMTEQDAPHYPFRSFNGSDYCTLDPAATPTNIYLPSQIGGWAKEVPDCSNPNTQVSDKLWALLVNAWKIQMIKGVYPTQTTPTPAMVAPVINHELFHLLGLWHPFQGNAATAPGTGGYANNCADAPTHPASQTTTQPYNYVYCEHLKPAYSTCDNISEVTNNLMDYGDVKVALSPCQLGVAQGNLTSCLSRYIYQCGTCLPADAWFTLNQETYHGVQGLWLEGRAVFNATSYTLEIDDVTPSIVVRGPHYQLTTSGSPYRIYLDGRYNFLGGRTYRIRLTAFNACGATNTYTQTYQWPRPDVESPTPTRLVAPSSSTLNPASRHD